MENWHSSAMILLLLLYQEKPNFVLSVNLSGPVPSWPLCRMFYSVFVLPLTTVLLTMATIKHTIQYLLQGLKCINHRHIVTMQSSCYFPTHTSLPPIESNSKPFLRVRLQGESMSKPDVGPAPMKAFTDTVLLSQPDGCTPCFFVYL